MDGASLSLVARRGSKVGSPAPDFNLPGVDGKAHGLKDYASSKVLVVIFSCNHCPVAQMYESESSS
jgi:peroxiredoxin